MYLTFTYVTFSELPDPPENVTIFNIGTRWLAMRWTPTFNGNRPVLRFILYIRNESTSAESSSFMAVANLSSSEVMSRGNAFMFNVSREGVVFPFTRYSSRVVSCNEIGCSEQSQNSNTIQTDEDSEFQLSVYTCCWKGNHLCYHMLYHYYIVYTAASPPVNLTVVNVTSTNLTLQWEPPMLPHGIITAYRVSWDQV